VDVGAGLSMTSIQGRMIMLMVRIKYFPILLLLVCLRCLEKQLL